MFHIYQKAKNNSRRTIVLLHGTGGDEYDLLPIATYYDEDAAVISLRGMVQEQGMNRFFKRLSAGVFDEEDLMYRTDEFQKFLETIFQQYELDLSLAVLVGYSNGANLIASYLLHVNTVVSHAILHHPMVPHRFILPDRQHTTNVLVLASDNDPIVPTHQTEELCTLLNKTNHQVTQYLFKHGHQLAPLETQAAKNWLLEG
jgi:phospholipase/carboxylesterase